MLALGITSGKAYAGLTFSPYVSIRSTKSVKPTKSKSTETETVKQRKEAGLRAGIKFWRLFSLQLGVGQSKLTTTEKIQEAKDEYGEIDYEKDLNLSTNDPLAETKITETQSNGRVTLVIDPSFGPFILRGKAGVIATQRQMDVEREGTEKVSKTFGPTYKPTSGFGAGIRFTPRMYALAEYNFYHYASPEPQPFEREVAVTYAIEL
jgi:hypothetical protein